MAKKERSRPLTANRLYAELVMAADDDFYLEIENAAEKRGFVWRCVERADEYGRGGCGVNWYDQRRCGECGAKRPKNWEPRW